MRLKGKILAAMLVASIAFGGVGTCVETQAACSSYTEYKKKPSFCDNTDGCGALWLKDTKKHFSYQERYCDKNGKQYRETRQIYVKEGCC